MKIISAILILTFLASCSEEQVFDMSFKENERYYLAGYCEPTDSYCTADVDKYIDDCFEESDYDPAMFSSINNNVDWKNPQEVQQSMENIDLSEMSKFKNVLNTCMANKIGGSFAKNMEQGKASWESNVKITRPPNQSADCLLKLKSCDKTNLIKIQISEIIKINSKQIQLSNVANTILSIKAKKPNAYIELIKYNQVDDTLLKLLKKSINKTGMKINSTSWIKNNKR